MAQVTAKRAANIRGQKHMLAYITKGEARMLRSKGGAGKPGPKGIPSYFFGEGQSGYSSGGGYGDFGGDDPADDMDGPAGGDTSGNMGPDSASGGSYGGSFGGGGSGDQPTAAELERARTSTKTVSTPVPGRSPARAPDERTKAQREIEARIDRLDRYSKDDNNNYINRTMAKANVLGAKRVSDKLNEVGSIPIRNKKGEVVGVMHEGPFGLGKVYSGRSLSSAEYAGPKEFANNVVLDFGDDTGSDDVRAGAKEKKPVEIIDGKRPDAPEKADSDSVDVTKKYGPQDTIATTPQGLLNEARTRRRSLFSGGLIT